VLKPTLGAAMCPSGDRHFANVLAGQELLTARGHTNVIQAKTGYHKIFLKTDTRIPEFMVTESFNEKNDLSYNCTVISKAYFVNMLGKDDGRITTFDKRCVIISQQ
jgi:hypothetical protein